MTNPKAEAKRITKKWASIQSLNYMGLMNDIESSLLRIREETIEECVKVVESYDIFGVEEVPIEEQPPRLREFTEKTIAQKLRELK